MVKTLERRLYAEASWSPPQPKGSSPVRKQSVGNSYYGDASHHTTKAN
ncbi:hypothetical protein MQ524_002478 [Salmonella enterica]|nr:hypothetical protein [Salmonella enterica]